MVLWPSAPGAKAVPEATIVLPATQVVRKGVVPMSRLEIVPLSRFTGAEVRGLDLSEPLSDDNRRLMIRALGSYGVLLVRNQRLTDGQQLAVTRSFGTVVGHPLADLTSGSPAAKTDPAVSYLDDLPGVDYAGKAHRQGAIGWHTDLSYMPNPQIYSALYGLKIPADGGDTLFANLTAAYDALDRRQQWVLEHLWCLHWLSLEQEPVPHPLVRVHPLSRRKNLYVSPSVSRYVIGLSEGRSRWLLHSLSRHCTRRQFTWRHVWQPHDLLIWDNRHTIHSRTPFNLSEHRLMRRTQTVGEPVIAARRRRP